MNMLLNVWSDISSFASAYPTEFYSLVIGAVLLLSIILSVLVIQSAKNGRKKTLSFALDVMDQADRYQREREEKRLLRLKQEQEEREEKRLLKLKKEEEERAKREAQRLSEESGKNAENAGGNGESAVLVKSEATAKKRAPRRRKPANDQTNQKAEKEGDVTATEVQGE